MIDSHPALAIAIRTPLFPGMCLGICILVVYGEKYLKRPDIQAEFLRVHYFPPGVSTALAYEVMGQGQETFPIDCDVIAEIFLVNAAEHEVTIRKFSAEVLIPHPWLFRISQWMSAKFPKRRIKLSENTNLDQYTLKTEKTDASGSTQTVYQGLADLLERLRKTPMKRGIGYTGWIGFTAQNMDRKEAQRVQIRIKAVDALGYTHPVRTKDDNSFEENEHAPKLIPPL